MTEGKKGNGISTWLVLTEYKGKSFSGVTPSWRSELLFKPQRQQWSGGAEGSGVGVQMGSWVVRPSTDGWCEEERAQQCDWAGWSGSQSFQDSHQGPSPVLLWAALPHMHTPSQQKRKPHPPWFAKSPQYIRVNPSLLSKYTSEGYVIVALIFF